MFVYPIVGHWIWGGGWLSKLGFHDFAGGTVVHTVGGMAALMGAKIVGPRIDKYDKNGRGKAIPGHNIILGALGIMILWFGWFGFNGGSVITSGAADKVGNVFFKYNFISRNCSGGCYDHKQNPLQKSRYFHDDKRHSCGTCCNYLRM